MENIIKELENKAYSLVKEELGDIFNLRIQRKKCEGSSEKMRGCLPSDETRSLMKFQINFIKNRLKNFYKTELLRMVLHAHI